MNKKGLQRKTKWLICWCYCSSLGKPVIWAEFLTLCQCVKISHYSAKRLWNAAKTTYGKWIIASYNLLPWLWSHKPSMEGKPPLVWEISQSPYRGPQSCSGRVWDGEDTKLASWLYKPVSLPLAHLSGDTLGLENPQIKSSRRNSCCVLKSVLHSIIISHFYYL